MSNVTIPQLPVAVSLSGSENVELDQSGTSVRTTTQAISRLSIPSGGTTGSVLVKLSGANYDLAWSSGAGTGTVTSVALSGGTTGLTVSGSPITSSGTITLGGTLAVANGGTGQTSYTDGQLLIGNTSTGGLTKATLTAGSNITITNGNGSISIAAAASSPGGSNTQVQYNNAGSLGGISRVTTDGTNLALVGSSSGSTTLQATAVASGTLTFPAATDTLIGKATTDILTNKTFDTAGTGNVFKINGTQITANTGTGSNVLASSPTITSATLTTPTIGSAGATFAGATSGTTTVAATATASGTLTLPAATDTLVGKATTDILTNKTYDTAGTGNVLKINGTQVSAVTGTGSVVLATSPSLTTPTLGAASATTINKITLTTPATGATLTLTDNKTFAVQNTLTLAGTDSTTMTFPGTSSTVLTTGNTATITKGYTLTPNNIGTVSSGTTTLDPTLGNYQYLTNNGAFTLAAPSSDSAIDLLVTNGASAGSITFSGFTVSASTGDALTTTNTNKFIISVRRINGTSTYLIKALQ